MSKLFYLVVPFSPVENEEGGFVGKMTGIFGQKETVNVKDELFDTYRTQLMQRVDHCIAALTPTGVRATLLGTEEVIELLYNSYNPSIFTTTVVKNIQALELQSAGL